MIAAANSKLVVYGPQTLVEMFPQDDPVILANYANFGHIPYGQSLVLPMSYFVDRPDLL